MDNSRIKKYIRRTFKYIGIFFGSIFIFLLFAFLCIRFQFVENAIKNYALGFLNKELEAYNLQVSVEDLDLNLPVSVRLRNITVNDDKGEFLHAEALSLNSRLLALFRYQAAIPGIDLKYLTLQRMPTVTIPPAPEQEEKKEELTAKEQFEQIHALLFHKYMPSILVSNISFEHMTINPLALNSIKHAEKIEERFFDSPLVLDAKFSASIEKELCRFNGKLTAAYQNNAAEMESLFDIFPNQTMRFSLDYKDEKGVLIELGKTMANLPSSSQAHAMLSTKFVGTFSEFEIDANLQAFDDIYLKDTANFSAHYSSKPFKGNINFSARPFLADVLNNADITAKIDLDTFSVSDSGERLEKMEIMNEETGEITTIDPNMPFEQAVAVNGEAPNKNVSFVYDINFRNMEFVSPMLKELLGSEQQITGQFDVQFFVRQLPRFFAKNVNFLAKSISSKTNIAISREVFVHSDFNINNFSFLNTEKQTTKGNMTGVLNIAGNIENPQIIFQANIPELVTTEYAGTEDKNNNNNGKELTLEKLKFILKSKGFEKPVDVIPLDMEKMRALYEKHQYAASIQRMRELFYSAVNYPVKLALNFNADYMDEHSFLNADIRLSPKVLGIGENENKFIELSKVHANIFGASLDGNMYIDLPESIEEEYAVKGKLQGKMPDASALENAFFLPLQINNLSYSAEFNVTPQKGQQVRVSMNADNGAYDLYNWTKFNAKIHADDVWKSTFVDNSIQFASLELGDLGTVKDVSLTLKGLLTKMLLHASFKGDAVFDTKAALSTNFENLSGTLSHFNFEYPYKKTKIRLQKPVNFLFSPANMNVQDLQLAIAPKGELRLGGQLAQNTMNLNGKMSHIDLSFLPLDLKGILSSSFAISGTPRSPKGNIELLLKDFQTLVSPKVSFALKGNIIQAAQEYKLSLALNILEKEKYGVEKAHVTLQIPLQYTPLLSVSKTRPVQGQFAYKGSLKTLWSYVPLDGRSLEGQLDLNGNISGTLERLDINYTAKSLQAKYEDLILGIMLTDLNFECVLKKGHGTVKLSAKDGREGTIALNGSFDVPFLYHGRYQPAFIKKNAEQNRQAYERQVRNAKSSALIMDLKTELSNFNPFYRNDFFIVLSGFVTAEEMVENPKIAGDISIDNAEVHLENIRYSSIPALNIVEDSSVRIRKKRAGSRGNLGIDIHIPRQVGVYAPGIETLWKGDMSVLGKIQEPAIKGTLRAFKGQMKILNSELKLDKGEIIFDGSTPIAPIVDLKLAHSGKGVQSYVTLKGLAFHPEIEISSNPYLPSDEVLAHILFARSMTELSDFEKIRLAAVLTSLMGFDVSRGITGTTKNLFGLDVVSIDNKQSAGGEEEISVELGKYLRNNVYVGLEQEVNSQDTAGVLKYEVNEHLSAGTKVGTEDSSIGFQWKYDY